jgi:hypothetical protein
MKLLLMGGTRWVWRSRAVRQVAQRLRERQEAAGIGLRN